MIINDGDNKSDSLENKAKIKIKDYFKEHKTLTKNNFSKFINYIGLSEIWSTEEEQNIFWEKIVQNSENKNEIDYNSVVGGFKEFFEEEVNDDIDDVNDVEENNLSSNENDNDLLLDIDLQSLHMKSLGFEQEENENFKKKIEEFINNIKDNQKIIYSIRFINEIFFSDNLSQEDVEKNLEKNHNLKNFKIDKEEIINEIKSKYNFINLENEFFINYFDVISKQNDTTKKELLVENSHLEYLNKLINDINTKDKKNSLIKPININLIKARNIPDNINISLNLKNLKEYDSMIIECIGAIKNLNYKNTYIDLVKEYIEKYIINLRTSIYDEIKLKDKEYSEKLVNLNNADNIDNINKQFEEEKNISKLGNEQLMNENNDNSNDLELIQLKEEEDFLEKGLNNNFNSSDNKPIKESKNITKKAKNKIIIPPLKINMNNEEESKITKECINNKDNEEEIQKPLKMNVKKSDNKIPENRINSINSTNDVILEDLTNSDIDLFSINNNNNITDQFLLDTTRLCNEEDKFNKNNENKIINNKNEKNGINYSNGNLSDRIFQINEREGKQEHYEDEFYDNLYFNLNNRKKNNIPLTDRNYRRVDNPITHNINMDYYCLKESDYSKVFKAQTYLDMDVNKILTNKRKLYTNEDIFYGYVNKTKTNFYDFNYLSKEHKIKRIFLINNEKLIKHEFFSDGIRAYFTNTKIKKYILIITYKTFYFLNNNETFECAMKLGVNSLKSIMVSKKNFNLLNLSFKGGTDVIIETIRRIEMLRFIQIMIDKGIINKDLKITATNYFFMNKKNGTKEKIPTIKNNNFIITPNFENAQKVGILLKYKEGFFSSYFQEKLFALCSIGLIYFDEDYKTPKNIIPIIGTTIKFIVVQLNKRIYCLKMKTINDENFILGSYQKKEIFDWLKELADYKKIYQLKMKQINPNFVADNSPEFKNNILNGFYY